MFPSDHKRKFGSKSKRNGSAATPGSKLGGSMIGGSMIGGSSGGSREGGGVAPLGGRGSVGICVIGGVSVFGGLHGWPKIAWHSSSGGWRVGSFSETLPSRSHENHSKIEPSEKPPRDESGELGFVHDGHRNSLRARGWSVVRQRGLTSLFATHPAQLGHVPLCGRAPLHELTAALCGSTYATLSARRGSARSLFFSATARSAVAVDSSTHPLAKDELIRLCLLA